MHGMMLAALLAALLLVAGAHGDNAFPLPFTRPLAPQQPPLSGTDVIVLQGLMARFATTMPVAITLLNKKKKTFEKILKKGKIKRDRFVVLSFFP